jgi:hypothetical protein
MPEFVVSLGERTAIDICIELLEGLHSIAENDRELQMAACYFLAKSCTQDERVISVLASKLADTRGVNQYVMTNERGTVGSDFYVDACAADALASLSSFDVAGVHTNHYESFLSNEAWSPRVLKIENDCLILTDEKLLGSGPTVQPASHFLREDCILCVHCNREVSDSWKDRPGSLSTFINGPTCSFCGKGLEVKTVRRPPRLSDAA